MPGKIIIYTDGAARGNPGPGGYGVVLMSGKHRKELSGGFKLTTNNRMELLAVIKGLEVLKIEGNGNNKKAVIKFESGTVKNLLLHFAKLKIIG